MRTMNFKIFISIIHYKIIRPVKDIQEMPCKTFLGRKISTRVVLSMVLVLVFILVLVLILILILVLVFGFWIWIFHCAWKPGKE